MTHKKEITISYELYKQEHIVKGCKGFQDGRKQYHLRAKQLISEGLYLSDRMDMLFELGYDPDDYDSTSADQIYELAQMIKELEEAARKNSVSVREVQLNDV